VQCRHDPSPTSPFDGQRCGCPERFGISNVEVYAVEDDERTYAGKIDLGEDYCVDAAGVSENVIEPGRYPLCIEDAPGPYEIEVTDTIEKREAKSSVTETTGVAFELFRDGQRRQLYRVDVSGASREVVYASASDFDGSATAGLLSGPLKTDGPPENPGNGNESRGNDDDGKGDDDEGDRDGNSKEEPGPPEEVPGEGNGPPAGKGRNRGDRE
jgi:hypothetical protein